MERVADGIFAITHDDATEVWPNGNTGVVVGDDGVLVFDADYLPSRARADIALIRRVTELPSDTSSSHICIVITMAARARIAKHFRTR